ncbi:MAG: phosphoribosyltransferase family protein [Oscillochloridaceae bacterium]|nr:phosphoribosyltransferase family protein [Chloroflexaceae bacterium]MDW8388542.1 phosphoribosyltransferase family protein [Oscillochloridaceae bacterium]
MAALLVDWLERALGFIFPDRCAGCGHTGALLCAACRAAARPACEEQPPPPGLDAVVVAWRYEGSVRQAVHALKYRRQRRVARALADALAATINERPHGDALIPVPLHPRRLAERGFNQSAELARHLARRWDVPLLAGGLVRQRDTGHQARLGRRERQSNVAGAFAWHAPAPPPLHVILVDDVLTTGATLGACAAALRAAGSRQVVALTLARALLTGDYS